MQQVRVHIPSMPIFERVVRASTSEIGALLGLSDERTEDLKLAVSEAVNNAIDHGARQPNQPIDVLFDVRGDMLEVHVRDGGGGLSASPVHRVIDEYALDAGTSRGLGFTLINALVDEYEIQTTSEGMTLILRLSLHSQE